MINALLVATALMAQALQAPPTQPAPPPVSADEAPAEVTVAAVIEELRKGELMLDADALAPSVANSFTLLEGGSRVSGAFAFLEPIRRARERGDVVRELRFDQLIVRAYGASAVATYRFRKRWKEAGAPRLAEGWCTDVFERRDDGAWVLIHRHRS